MINDQQSYPCPKCGKFLGFDNLYVNLIIEIDIECPCCHNKYSGESLIASLKVRSDEEERHRRKEEELHRIHAAERKKEEERIRKLAEDKRKEEELHRIHAEERKKEEERIRKLAEERKKEEERIRKLAEDKKKDNARLIRRAYTRAITRRIIAAEKLKKEAEERKRKRKRLIYCIAFGLVAILCAGGYFLYKDPNSDTTQIIISDQFDVHTNQTTVDQTITGSVPTATGSVPPTTGAGHTTAGAGHTTAGAGHTTAGSGPTTTTTTTTTQVSPKSAIERLEEQYQNGDKRAAYKLGCLYRDRHHEGDNTRAFEWFKKSAENGEPNSMYELGECYMKGIGVRKDRRTAIYWWRKAAEGKSQQAIKRLSEEDNELQPD